MPRVIIILIATIVSFAANGQVFSNLRAAKQANQIIIKYDISATDPDQTFDIKLECSADGGKTFNIFPQFISGDLKGISAGNGKEITWNIQQEEKKYNNYKFVFQLVAIQNLSKKTPKQLPGTFIDPRDGHMYKWMKIGTQIWMIENLAYLPEVSPSKEGSSSKAHYYIYGYQGENTDEAKATENYKKYGVLYNWTAAQKACPAGWHLPTDNEWKQLELTLGMSIDQANKTGSRGLGCGAQLKSKTDWLKPGNGTNTSGFDAYAGGGRYGDGSFGNMGSNGYWWTSTESDAAFSWGRGLSFGSSEISKGATYKEGGFSVRCVKDL